MTIEYEGLYRRRPQAALPFSWLGVGKIPQKARDCDAQLNARHFGLGWGPTDRTVACP